jgi:acyl-CoA thioester hydrolase
VTQEFRRCHDFRVRFAEVDAQAVVFNSRYLEYADIVLTEFLRAAGIPMTGPDAFEVHVVQATVHYRRPLRFDEQVSGRARTAKIGRSSMLFEIELRVDGEDEARATIELTYVHVDLATGRPAEVPAEVRTRLLQ